VQLDGALGCLRDNAGWLSVTDRVLDLFFDR